MIRLLGRHAAPRMTARAGALVGALLASLLASLVVAPGGAPAAGATGRAPAAVAPYLSLGWGDPPDPVEVMEQTGIRSFSLAFVLSAGECTPAWDGRRPLTGGVDERTVRAVRVAGGDVVPSFGGGLGNKLEEDCRNARALAGAYQQVIDAYGPPAIDIDIETGAYKNPRVRARTIAALKRVRAANPGLTVYVTLPSHPSGPDDVMIDAAAAAGFEADAWSIMPFAFGEQGRAKDMGDLSIRAAEGLVDTLRNAYGYSEAEAYRHSGVSSMAGITGHDELITVGDFRELAAYAARHGLARLTFWSVNRDRACPTRRYVADDSCSGTAQRPWAYTRALATYRSP